MPIALLCLLAPPYSLSAPAQSRRAPSPPQAGTAGRSPAASCPGVLPPLAAVTTATPASPAPAMAAHSPRPDLLAATSSIHPPTRRLASPSAAKAPRAGPARCPLSASRTRCPSTSPADGPAPARRAEWTAAATATVDVATRARAGGAKGEPAAAAERASPTASRRIKVPRAAASTAAAANVARAEGDGKPDKSPAWAASAALPGPSPAAAPPRRCQTRRKAAGFSRRSTRRRARRSPTLAGHGADPPLLLSASHMAKASDASRAATASLVPVGSGDFRWVDTGSADPIPADCGAPPSPPHPSSGQAKTRPPEPEAPPAPGGRRPRVGVSVSSWSSYRLPLLPSSSATIRSKRADKDALGPELTPGHSGGLHSDVEAPAVPASRDARAKASVPS